MATNNPKELRTEKLESIKPEGFSAQICLRCYKQPAVLGEVFCAKCLLERQELDEMELKENKVKQPDTLVKPKLDRTLDELKVDEEKDPDDN